MEEEEEAKKSPKRKREEEGLEKKSWIVENVVFPLPLPPPPPWLSKHFSGDLSGKGREERGAGPKVEEKKMCRWGIKVCLFCIGLVSPSPS